MSMLNTITSTNGRLTIGTMEKNIQNINDEKEKQKQIELFKKTDINNDGILSEHELKEYDLDTKKKKFLTIAGITIGAIAVGVGIYLAKSGKIAKFFDNITQKCMNKNLSKAYGDDVLIQKGANGSLFIPSDASAVPTWKADGVSNFDKFIKRYGLTAIDDAGAEVGKYTMASRGTLEASGNVTMTIPTYKDKFGRVWTMIQEEARPIDILRRGKDARILAFPAGCIGDEAKFISESAKDCAIRELAEETGMVAKKIKNLTPQTISNGKSISVPIMTSPGLTDEATYFYSASVEKFKPSTKAITDGGVTRGWHFVPLKNIHKWFSALAPQGKIPSGQTLTGLTLLEKAV